MVIEVLEERSIRFTDVGMGVQLNDHRLGRVVRVTTSTPQVRDHFLSRVSFEDAAGNDEGMDSDFPSSVWGWMRVSVRLENQRLWNHVTAAFFLLE